MSGFRSGGRGSKGTTEIWNRIAPTNWRIRPVERFWVRQKTAARCRQNLGVSEGETPMASIAEANSLFEIDMELDGLLEEIQEQVEPKVRPRRNW